jgi:hypothetical protein
MAKKAAKFAKAGGVFLEKEYLSQIANTYYHIIKLSNL